ncbi:MAG: ferritin-like domain-containing protein, partial [Verrucomicrobiales bacterium]
MSDPLPVSLRLDDGDTGTGTPISQIVESHLKSRGRNRSCEPVDPDTLWDVAYFGLDRVRLFRQATETQQKEVLAGCARGLLNEAYFIEKSGAAYCAKMILLAESTEVRQVYSLIAADEASHLQWIRPHVLEADRDRPSGALLTFLGDLIERCDRNTLAYLVQVILEGWGLHHYRSLSQSCCHPGLREIFQAIHKDEALHHHTGEVLFDPRQVTTAEQQSLVRSSLRTYTEMVRVGPQGVV